MADNLIFPVKFDLEAAVRKAQGDADKYLRQLQTTIHSKPLAIDLKIVNAGSGSLNEISKRMRDIVTEWNNMSEAERIASKTSGEYTDRAKKLIAEFARLTGASETYARSLQQIVAASRRAANEQEKAMEKQRKTQAILLANEKSIANITAKLKYWKDVMNSSDMGGKRFRKAAEEVRRLNQSLGEAQRNVNSLTGQFKNQDGYVSRLVKRLVVYAGFQQINNFLTSVRSVTAEFELQRISLGAIIQDQAKANALFSEIKNFALKSPIKILDLTKYTKQLAAYKIGVNELFDTTKRLADISVGLGVSMDRLILLYGQVRATGYLRASEIRQATEAGIPLVEELANKLSEANGTLVTSAQVLKMVEERAISFEMVKEVFEDMTNAGGLFYDMQEKQGNTLYGMWQKLGDAAAMMYDEIGNTPWVNEGMKEAINMLRTLMIEWKRAGANIATLGVAVLLYANKTKLATLATKLNTAANTEGSTALRGRILHLKKAIMYQNLFATSTTATTTATKLFTYAQLRLTQALNLTATALKKVAAALAKNIWGLIAIGVSLLVEHLLLAKDAAKELKNELANINLDYEGKQGQDAANLEYLANAAVNAAKGSKAQKDALEELKNTYGKIIPMELLTIENLERMKGNYGELIALIDEYNLKQKYEKETSAIESSFAPKEEERANKIRNILRDGLRLDYADEATGGVFDKVLDLSERNIQRFLLNLKKYADEGLDKKEQIIRASADLAAELGLNEGETEALTKAMIDLDRRELEGQGTLMDYTEGLQQKHEAMAEVTDDYEKQKKALNEYSAVVDEVMKKNEEEPEVTASKDEFENEKARLNNQISDVASGIVELLNKANVAVDNGTQQILNTVIQNGGMIPDAVWGILEKAAEAANNPKLLAAIQDLRKHYKGLAPDNQTVNFIKDRMTQIASTAGLKMKEFRQYLWDGQGDIKTYQENLQKSINTLRAQAVEMISLNYLIDAGLAKGQKYDVKEIHTLQAKADALQQLLDTSVTPLVMPDDKKSKSRGGKGSKSDNRLQNLQEIEQTLTKINQKYDELAKKEGQTKALEDINKLYGNTLKYVNKLGKQFKLTFKMPTEFKDLQDYRKAILDVINKLRMKGYEKAALDLEEKIGTGNIDKLQKDIEKQLKGLSDRISRTKTAKEFYEKILGMTGDYDLAAKVSLSIYGDTGYNLQKQLAEQIRTYFDNENVKVEIPVDVITADNQINYKRLGEFAEQMKEKLGEEPYKAIKKIAEEGKKDLAKTYEGYLKDLEKAKIYADKRVELARTTAAKIREIESNPQLTKEQKAELKRGYQERENVEAARLEYDAFKETPLYIQMFEDLEHASTSTLEMMKRRLERLKGVWGTALDPTQLKDIQSRMNEIDEQLRTRNPFKTLKESYQQYRDAVKGVSLFGAVQNAGAAAKDLYNLSEKYGADSAQARAAATELNARREIVKIARKITAENKKGAKALDAAAQIANDNLKIARGHLDIAKEQEEAAVSKAEKEGKDPAKDPRVIAAREKVEAAKKEVNLAERVAEITTNYAHEAKTWKESLSAAAETAFVYLNAASDLAHSIADLTEEFGGSEEDVQYWNDIGDALGNIAAGAQDLIKNILDFNVAGMVSSIVTALPKMAIGFSQLFSAGKIKRANKEIKRQQQLLEQLEYTYGRLEAATDKVFGRDYLNNYNQQLKNLQAQQAAYEKQARAERSKGKKKDKDKIKEYEEQARETADKIKELQDDLVAHFTGSSRTDVARQMAQSWIDARASMSDTFAAIKGDYQDLIKNMIVEGAAARVIENALTPVWDSMEKMLEKNDVQGAIDSLVNGMDSALNAANNGMEVLWKALEARGYDMKKLIGDTDSEYTGIAKSVAGATSEEINNVAAIGNTLMYYVSPIPRIDENLARVVAIMEGRAAALPTASGVTTGAIDYTEMFTTANQHLSSLPRMEQHLAEIHTMLGRALKTKGATSGFNVFLNA